MLNLVHNIDFVIAALVVLIVLYVSTWKKFGSISESNRFFYYLVRCAIFSCVADIALNVAQTYPETFTLAGCKILRIVYSIAAAMTMFLMYGYTRTYQSTEDRKTDKVGSFFDIIIVGTGSIYVLVSVANLFAPAMFYYDSDFIYREGPLHFLSFIVPIIMGLLCILTTAFHRKSFTIKQEFAVYAFVLLGLFGTLLEMLLGSQYLLAMFGVALSIIIVHSGLVTPEYKELLEALELQEKIANEARVAKDNAERMRYEAENARIAAEASFHDAQASKLEAMDAQLDAEKAKEEAIAANQAKSEFLARMSHEIRTPMNSVLGFSQMIKEESSDDKIKGYAKDAEKATENLLSIINDILDFSKIESGKLEIIDGEYNFADMIREEYNIFIFKAKEKKLKLVFEIDENIPRGLFGDDIRIKQILTNLLSNSIKYTETGSVTLKVSMEGKGRSSVLLKFTVKDTGIGIKEEDIGRLYDAFERIEEKRNRNIEGTGLGINIVIQLLTMMGSKLFVDSVYGLGSQFSFSIRQTITDVTPIGNIEDKTFEKANENIKPLINAPEAKVLVVDDNSMNLKVFTGLLKKTGINIDAAQSGYDALDFAKANKYDIIFMDHLMPGMDGIETFNKLKEQTDGLNRDTVVIALTANALKGAREEYLGYGFNDVVFKPAKINELNEALWNYLDEALILNK